MADEQDDIDEFGDTVLPVEIEDAAVPISLTELQPWHHPRKQYVRERQWKLYTKSLVERLRDQQKLRSGVVKYLTLPGIDYFDVEVIGRTVSDLGLRLEATSFLAEAEKEPIRARSQVREDSLVKLGLMEDTSVTFPYRFEQMAHRKSQAYREIKARAPFNIVNIDACGSVAAPAANQPNRIIDAIHELMNLQFSEGRDNWALFLTADARNNSISEEVRNALKEAIRANSNESQQFADGARALLSGDINHGVEEALAFAEGSDEHFLPLFSLGFAKWILHNANDVGWDVKSRQFYCYSTRPQDQDAPSMACMAFEFSPRPVVMNDQFGAVAPQPAPENNDTDYSMQALQRAQGMDNLDQLMQNDAEVRQQFSAMQRDLLVSAGYQAAALDKYDELFS